MTAKKEVIKKDETGLETKESMKAKGKGTGITAKLSFQFDGKHHEAGQEVLGVDEKGLKTLKEQGLI